MTCDICGCKMHASASVSLLGIYKTKFISTLCEDCGREVNKELDNIRARNAIQLKSWLLEQKKTLGNT